MVTIGLTTEQLAAVNSEGGALLVSAAAGSGKTRVLVERLMRKIESGDNIDDFLIITYTNAAASELRGKILDALYAKIAISPDSTRLHRQINLCSRAHIETIHSFCLWLIRKNVNRLELTPDVRVADDGECNIIKRDVLERLLEERYSSEDSEFLALADTMGAGRDDSKLLDITLQTHSKLLSHPDPEKWVQTQLAALELDGVTDIADTIWGKLTLERVKKDVLQICGELEKLLDTDEDVYKAYGASIETTLADAERFANACDSGWDAARDAKIQTPRVKPLKGHEHLKEKRKKYNKMLNDRLAELQDPSLKLLDDMKAVAPIIRAALNLVLDFDKRYSEVKRSRGILDFSDQEHLALKLLRDKSLSIETAEIFKEILIDEYQDVNSIQEEIFMRLTERGNVFMVGDVKQSIYRFRLAEPEIFLRKYFSFKDVSEVADGEPRKVVLSKNFRSRAEILNACNYVFRNIMSSELGDIDYTEREFLYAGREDFGEPPEPPVELDIIDAPDASGSSEDEDAPELDELEARFAAKRILQLVGTFPLENGKRAANFSDIAVLMRSPKNRIGTWLSVFDEYGIPTAVEEKQSFFDEPEVSLVLSLLAIIDNPHQDPALVSVLRSPLFGFTPDELAAIRSSSRDGDFYTALQARADSDTHCGDFLRKLDELRELSPEMSADRFLWHIYNNTSLFAIVADETRKRNLMELLSLAVSCESSGFKGLFGFEIFVRRLIETGQVPTVGSTGNDNAVRFMSIHKSKGLEFPIVILANLTKSFNRQDTMEPLLVHPQLGFGPKVTHLNRKISYSTIARRAIREKLSCEMMSEEMRILYVAMTRASEKLIMLMSYRDADKQIDKLCDSELPVPPLTLKSVKSHAAWLLCAALRREESVSLYEENGSANVNDGSQWLMRVIKDVGTADNIRVKADESVPSADKNDTISDTLREKLEYIYPYEKSALLSSKLTATEMKGSFREQEAAEEAHSIIAVDTVVKPPIRPAFMGGTSGLTAAEKGTATHIVMQYADYDKCRTLNGVRSEIERLRVMHNITNEEAAAINPFVILRFFDSQVGKLLLNADKVWRELKFSILVDSNELDMESGEKLLLQGVVDCCVLHGDKLVILDFKTDYVDDHNIDERTEFYRGQLEVYALAMRKILKYEVETKLLCFLNAGVNREL